MPSQGRQGPPRFGREPNLYPVADGYPATRGDDAHDTASVRRTIGVRNDSRRAIRVSSHYPFHRVNQRLLFDRATAVGFRLDLPAGASERWAPGETREVVLVRYGGSGGDLSSFEAPSSRRAAARPKRRR